MIDETLEELIEEAIQDEVASTELVLSSPLPDNLILYPLDTAVVFPGMFFPLEIPAVGDARTVMDQMLDGNRMIGFVTIRADRPQENHREQAEPQELHRIGVAARIAKVFRMPDDSLRVLCQTLCRFRIERFRRADDILVAKVSYPPDIDPIDEKEETELEVLRQRLQHEVQELIQIRPDIPEEAAQFVATLEGAGAMADFVGANFQLQVSERQHLLEAFDVRTRVEMAMLYLTRERELADLGARLHREIAEKIEKNQKDYMIREQIKLLRRELGEDRDEREVEIERFQEALAKEGLPEDVRQKGESELKRLSQLSPEATEYNMVRTYLEWLTDLPWGEFSEDRLDLKRSRKILDDEHFGLGQVKDRLIEYLAVRIRNAEAKGSIICLCGPPGTGKTSIALSIAKGMGRKLHRVSLGGMRDEAEIKGHRRTYVGAMPGKLIQGIKRAGSMNPVFVLDEIDKLGSDWRGDPSSAMLEVLDPAQNHNFMDHYLDVPCDLSQVFFIATANDAGKIPRPLLDRMELIQLDGYIPEEKLQIARRHLLPRVLKEHGISRKELVVHASALRSMITGHTREAGVRDLNRKCQALARKATAKIVTEGEDAFDLPLRVKSENLPEWLGAPRYVQESMKGTRRPGLAVGLAWTPTGGDVLLIETSMMPGKGQVRVTGNLRQVMKESVEIALSYVRTRAEDLGINRAIFDQYNLHVHFPAGAVPKDGPSAGITITTALISLLTGRRAQGKVAMTGELTLRGDVTAVGGLREKVVAAKSLGFTTVVAPRANQKDIEEIPEVVLKGMNFVYAETFEDIQPTVLQAKPTKAFIPKIKPAKAEKKA
ncbi:MAG: endopeptidase La [Myxococcota bacterium]|nr:endopeptidase La [Myxococcota bacterium]